MSDRTPLTARIAAAAKRLADLKAERGAAVIDGVYFDHSRIADVEHEIAGLEEAEAEERRRTTQAKTVERSSRIPTLLSAIGDQEDRRLAAVGRAEAAARDLAAALLDVRSAAAEERRLVGSFSEAVTFNASAITAAQLEDLRMDVRLSKMLSLTMAPVTGGSHLYGEVRFPAHLHGFSADDAWSTVERREGQGLLGALEHAAGRQRAA